MGFWSWCWSGLPSASLSFFANTPWKFHGMWRCCLSIWWTYAIHGKKDQLLHTEATAFITVLIFVQGAVCGHESWFFGVNGLIIICGFILVVCLHYGEFQRMIILFHKSKSIKKIVHKIKLCGFFYSFACIFQYFPISYKNELRYN